jgi:methionyl-tRNA formyltransferase
VHPWPGAFAFLGGQRIKIHRAHVLLHDGTHGEPGRVLRADRHGLEVACGRGVLVVDELQPEGKRRMSAEQFCAGLRAGEALRFESEGADA